MMRGYKAPRPSRYLARCARWLGVDRNPLRRTTDRIETAIRLAMIILLVGAVPIVAVAVGQRADQLAMRQAHAQQAGDHLVNAVLLRQASATGIPDPYTSVQYTWALARWQPPDRPARSGEVLVPAGSHRGSTVPIWINVSGAITDPPVQHRQIVGDVCVAVAATCLLSVLVLLGSAALARRTLDRWRLDAWEAEWRANGPLGSGRPR